MCGSPFYPLRRVNLDQTDVCLLRELERGLPLVPAPFDEIGKRLGMDGDQVIERIRHLKEAGDHQEIPGSHRPAKGGNLRECPCGVEMPGPLVVTQEHCWQHFPQ